MELTDEDLIANYRRTKDASYFQSLVRRYQNRIFTTAVRVLGSTEGAEEVVQDTFVKVHQNLDKFRHEATFAAWAFKITHNICMDILRHKQRRQGFKVVTFDPQIPADEDAIEASNNMVSQLADPTPNPSQQLEFDEQEALIAASLESLPDNQRTVLLLHDVEGFSYQEIAEIVGTSIGTVRSRLHYGRLKLRELLEPYFSQKNVSAASR
ncbi:MAG TPA: sigma-70 family RNA polymerase sigma factor [Chroococcales cyanobacterium]